MGTRNIRHGIPALLLATAGLALAACGSSDDSGPAAASSPISSTASTPASASDSAAPATPVAPATPSASTASASSAAGTPGSAAGSGPSSCTTSHLKVTAGPLDSGAGSTMFQLVFQNTGSAPCTLRGYPGVSFVKAHDAQLGKAAARTGSGSTTTVTLIPNAHAYADVRTVNGQGGYDPGKCDLTTVPSLRIYPPNQTGSTNITWNKKECVGSTVQNLQVGPVHSNR
jgi:hypothetical protein